MATRVEVTIVDTMAFWNDEVGFLHDPNGRTQTSTYVFTVPETWVGVPLVGPRQLTHDGFERVCAYVYGGPNWRSGNGDGSAYVVRKSNSRILPDDDPRKATRLGD